MQVMGFMDRDTKLRREKAEEKSKGQIICWDENGNGQYWNLHETKIVIADSTTLQEIKNNIDTIEKNQMIVVSSLSQNAKKYGKCKYDDWEFGNYLKYRMTIQAGGYGGS